MNPRSRQSGMALLIAIILVAIATTLAVAIGYGGVLFAKRSTSVFTWMQAERFAQGAEGLAAYALQQSLQASPVISPDQIWAQPYGPAELDTGVTLEATLEDLQGRFNINSLITAQGTVDPQQFAQFQALLTLLGIDQGIASQALDWIDADSQVTSPDGAEDSQYLSLTPGYRTANIPITSVSELLALPGMTRAIYDRLTPYITALPPSTNTTLNICTASGVVLDSLAPGQQSFSLSPEQLTAKRGNGCFPSVAELQASLGAANWAKIANRVGTSSRYFRLRTWITIGTTRFTLYSLLARSAGGTFRPILRTYGTE
jgi:general secretion pathway protein K